MTPSLLRAIALQPKIQVSNILRNYGVDFISLPALENVFPPYLLEHGARGLSSEFENLSPTDIEVGRRRQWKKLKNGKRIIVEYKERYYYVSLLASLAALLSNRNIFDMVANQQEPERHFSLLHDFSNGTVLQDHPFFSIDHKRLKIIFYYDDVELTNEQTKRKQKMSMFYSQLGNIIPQYRGKLKNNAGCNSCFFGLRLYKTADFSIALNSYQIEEEEMATGLFVIEVQLMTLVMHIYKHERCQ